MNKPRNIVPQMTQDAFQKIAVALTKLAVAGQADSSAKIFQQLEHDALHLVCVVDDPSHDHDRCIDRIVRVVALGEACGFIAATEADEIRELCA